MTDAAGGSGSSGPKGGRPGAQAPHNPLYKTELCRSWLDAGSCRYGIRCQFAHGHLELRLVALLMQLPLVQGGDSYSSPLAAHRY
ncbi:hypothetical protein OEZ85_012804 [Tetradesmus obliquus]|uniref:C3H1-type domain-containing protein n=1 Tax=Tetradesmus obliquus TaxID=3088 RepID=A0ABY8U3Y6_TETOB|nr:hypothetical protein OEZ85_012804 [Tetradesmus obliquus]